MQLFKWNQFNFVCAPALSLTHHSGNNMVETRIGDFNLKQKLLKQIFNTTLIYKTNEVNIKRSRNMKLFI